MMTRKDESNATSHLAASRLPIRIAGRLDGRQPGPRLVYYGGIHMMPLDASSDAIISQRLLILYVTMVVVLRSPSYSTVYLVQVLYP